MHHRNTAIAHEPAPFLGAPLPAPVTRQRRSGERLGKNVAGQGLVGFDRGTRAELWRSCPEGWDEGAKVGAGIPN